MKKFILISLLSLALIAPLMVSAVTPPTSATQCKMRNDLTAQGWIDIGFTCPSQGATCSFDSPTYTCGPCCAIDTVYVVSDWFFVAVMVLVVIFVLMGAFKLLFAGGDAAAVTTGRNYIMYAAIGALVAMLAKAIPAIARAVIRV